MKNKYKISLVIVCVFAIAIGIFLYNKSLNKTETIDNNIIGIYLQDKYGSESYTWSSENTIPGKHNYVFFLYV